jgi:hypothetical protein
MLLQFLLMPLPCRIRPRIALGRARALSESGLRGRRAHRGIGFRVSRAWCPWCGPSRAESTVGPRNGGNRSERVQRGVTGVGHLASISGFAGNGWSLGVRLHALRCLRASVMRGELTCEAEVAPVGFVHTNLNPGQDTFVNFEVARGGCLSVDWLQCELTPPLTSSEFGGRYGKRTRIARCEGG